MLNDIPKTKKNKRSALPFIAKPKSKSKKTSLKKESESNVSDVPKTKKIRNSPPKLTFPSPSRNPGLGRLLLKKKGKRNVSNVPKTKKNERYTLPLIAKLKSKSKKASLKKESERNVSDIPKTKKIKKFTSPTYLS